VVAHFPKLFAKFWIATIALVASAAKRGRIVNSVRTLAIRDYVVNLHKWLLADHAPVIGPALRFFLDCLGKGHRTPRFFLADGP
jgi:hypothetical protein